MNDIEKCCSLCGKVKEWAGLTDVELHEEWWKWDEDKDSWIAFCKAIETKLKEKNT